MFKTLENKGKSIYETSFTGLATRTVEGVGRPSGPKKRAKGAKGGTDAVYLTEDLKHIKDYQKYEKLRKRIHGYSRGAHGQPFII